MARYMLDTNICVYLMKHQPPEVAERFAKCYVGDVVISAITQAELEYGVACSGEQQSRNRKALDTFLQEVLAVPFDGAAAAVYGPTRLATQQKQRDALDKLIASHALAMGVTLVTNNLSDFSAYKALKLENWVGGH
ncbi:VapC Predicted nucleic acid-binding protein, contains PIN domain [Burkholderiaceae bacterium]